MQLLPDIYGLAYLIASIAAALRLCNADQPNYDFRAVLEKVFRDDVLCVAGSLLLLWTLAIAYYKLRGSTQPPYDRLFLFGILSYLLTILPGNMVLALRERSLRPAN